MVSEGAEYVIRVRTEFEDTGLDKLLGKTRAAMQQIAQEAQSGALTPQAAAGQARTTLGAANERLSQLTRQLGRSTTEDAAREMRSYTQNFQGGVRRKNLPEEAQTLRPLLNTKDAAGKTYNLTDARLRGAYDLSKKDAAQALAAEAAALKASTLGVSQEAAERAEGKLAHRQMNAEIGKVLAADDAYSIAAASAAVSFKQIQAGTVRILAADDQYAQATAALALNRNNLRAREAAQKSTPENLAGHAERVAAERALDLAQRRAVLENTSAQSIKDSAVTKVGEKYARDAERFNIAQLQSVSTPTGQASADREASTIAAEKMRAEYIRGAVARDQAADTRYITQKAETVLAERDRSVRIRAATAGVDIKERSGPNAGKFKETGVLEAEAGLRERITAERTAAEAARISASQDVGLGAELAVARRERIAAERGVALASARASIAAGEGTRFQRFQAKIGTLGANPRTAGEYNPLGAFIGQKALTSVGYALPAAALYGSISAVRQLVDQAQELEKIMNQVQAQFQATDSAGDFPIAKAAILSIAKSSGVAADEVANTFMQFKGAFGDVTTAIDQTGDAMKIVAVTGLSLKEVVDSLTAVSKTYADETTGQAYDLEKLGNAALFLQEQFGVASKESLTFVADLAPVGKEAGATVDELLALGAVSQQLSGRPGSGLAESYGRILPAIQESKTQLLALYSDPKLAKGRETILNALAGGDTFEVLKQLLRDTASGDLSANQVKYAQSLLGSRREAQALIPVFNEAGTVLKAMDDTAAASDIPRLENYFKKLQGTVANSLARMKEAFKQLGQALFEAGLADALTAAAFAGGLLAQALVAIVSPIAQINTAMGGWAVKLALVAAAIKVMSVAWGKATVAVTANTAATAANITAQETEALLASGLADGAPAAAGARLAGAQARAGSFLLRAPVEAGAGGVPLRTANWARRGLGLGETAVGFTGAAYAGLGLTAVLASNYARNQQNPKVDQAQAALEQRMKNMTDRELENISEAHTNFFDKFAIGFFGNTLPEELAKDVLTSRKSETQRTDLSRLAETNADLLAERLGQGAGKNAADLINQQQKDHGDDIGIRRIAKEITSSGAQPTEFQTITVKSGDFTVEGVKKIIARAKEGDAWAGRVIVALGDDITTSAAVQKALGDYDKDKKAKELGPGAAALDSADVARTKYEAGISSRNAYAKALATEITGLKDLLSRGEDVDIGGESALALAKLEGDYRALILDRAKKLQESAGIFRKITGTESAAGDLSSLIGYFNTRTPQGDAALTMEEKAATAVDLYEATQKAFLEQLSSIADPAERLRRMQEGMTVPPELIEAAIASQLGSNASYAAVAEKGREVLGDERWAQFEAQAIEIAKNSGRSVKEVLLEIINREITLLERLLAFANGGTSGMAEAVQLLSDLKAQRDVIESQLDDIKLPDPYPEKRTPRKQGPLGGRPGNRNADRQDRGSHSEPGKAPVSDEELDRANQAALDAELQKVEVRKVQARRDPVRMAQLSLEAANIELVFATQIKNKNERAAAIAKANLGVQQAVAGVDDAALAQQRSLVQARGALAEAGVYKNAGASAVIAMRTAQQLLATASSPEERLSAQASIQSALQASRDNFLNTVTSMVDLQIAVASAADDQILVAELQLQNARTRFQDAASRGAGTPELNALRADIVQQEANARNTRFNEGTSHIDYLLQMEKITTEQAVGMLKDMLAIPTNTQKMREQLELKIKQLNDGVSAASAFNIPDEIKLPTLYEARRLGQSQLQGGTFQDNRQINITINESDDPAGTLRAVSQALNAAPRNGIAPSGVFI